MMWWGVGPAGAERALKLGRAWCGPITDGRHIVVGGITAAISRTLLSGSDKHATASFPGGCDSWAASLVSNHSFVPEENSSLTSGWEKHHQQVD
jgi:hypothetical protein